MYYLVFICNKLCDFRSVYVKNCDAIEQLKFTSVVNVCNYLTMLVSESLGKSFGSLLPFFGFKRQLLSRQFSYTAAAEPRQT